MSCGRTREGVRTREGSLGVWTCKGGSCTGSGCCMGGAAQDRRTGQVLVLNGAACSKNGIQPCDRVRRNESSDLGFDAACQGGRHLALYPFRCFCVLTMRRVLGTASGQSAKGCGVFCERFIRCFLPGGFKRLGESFGAGNDVFNWGLVNDILFLIGESE